MLLFACIDLKNETFLHSACGCYSTGSQDSNCNNVGQCTCNDGYVGLKCDSCNTDGYYMSGSGPICTGTMITDYASDV